MPAHTVKFLGIYGDKDTRELRMRTLKDSEYNKLSMEEKKQYAELLPILSQTKDSEYTAYDRLDAVVGFISTGSVRDTAALCEIPPAVISRWAGTDWWKEALGVLQNLVQMEMDARMTSLMSKAIDQLEDRLDHGDEVINLRTGAKYRVRVKAKELAGINSSLYDKRALGRGDPTSVVKRQQDPQKALEALAAQFAKIASKNNKKMITTEIVDGERIIENAKED